MEFSIGYLFSALIFLAAIFKLYFTKNARTGPKSNLPPSPPRLPIIGNLHQLGKMPHISLHLLTGKLGPIMFLQLGEIPTVIVSSADMAREVMKTHDLPFSSRPQLYSAKWLFYDCTDIVFSPYGDYWRHVRKICILELLSAKRVQSYSTARVDEVSCLVQRIKAASPGLVNITKLLGLYANDVLCRVVLGRNFSAGGEYDQHGFQSMLEEYQELLGGFSIGDFFPSKEFINTLTGHKSRLQRTFRRFDKFFDEVIEEHRETWRMSRPFFWTCLRQELKAVVKEVYRLHPPVPTLVPRESTEDVMINGYLIPAKTRIFANVWAIGRDPKTWEDPDTFNPDRFVGSSIDFKGQDFELLPFGAGRRGCPGITFGIAIVELALAQLLHTFDWELPPGIQAKDLDLTETFGITTHKITDLTLVAKDHST